MEYMKATEEKTKTVVSLVQETIKSIYPKFYKKEVVDFFLSLHCEENINKDIKDGNVWVLYENGVPVGTGSYKDNHITRVYVLPSYQGKGYGSFIMTELEKMAALKYNKLYLDASLPASKLYKDRGYKTIEHADWTVENGVVLVYEIMEKEVEKRGEL